MTENNGQLNMEDTKPLDKKEGFQLLIYDLKQRQLIPLKILYFLFYAGYGVLFPFIPIHMKSLGMSLEEIGAVYATSSVCAILAPFFAGIVADKLGNFKILLSIVFGATGLTALLFMWIPVARIATDYSAVNISRCDNHSVAWIEFDSNSSEYLKLHAINQSAELSGQSMTEHQLLFHMTKVFPVVSITMNIILNPRLTFWVYLSIRLTFDTLYSAAETLFEGASLGLVNELGCDYGFQQMFGYIGVAIFSPVSGVLIDHITLDENSPNFKPAFYLFAGLFGIAAVVMMTVDLHFKPSAKELLNDLKSVLKNLELTILFVITFISGILWGCTANFLFIFLEEIDASKSLMGLATTVSSLTAIPLLLFSNGIFKNLGHPNVLVVGMVFYVIRLVGYSYLTDPKLCLLLESAEAITMTLMMTSIFSYANQLATKTTFASVQGLVAAIQYGLGAGVVGGYVTSFIIEAYGHRLTFRILGLVAFVTGFVYFLFNIAYIRRQTMTEKSEETLAPTPATIPP